MIFTDLRKDGRGWWPSLPRYRTKCSVLRQGATLDRLRRRGKREGKGIPLTIIHKIAVYMFEVGKMVVNL